MSEIGTIYRERRERGILSEALQARHRTHRGTVSPHVPTGLRCRSGSCPHGNAGPLKIRFGTVLARDGRVRARTESKKAFAVAAKASFAPDCEATQALIK